MSNILSRVAAIGIVAGGFALTGDLGKLARRGIDVVNARDVPWPQAEAADRPVAVAESEVPAVAPTTDAPQAAAGVPGDPAASATAPRAHGVIVRDTEFRPSTSGVDQVDPTQLDAGGRIVVWLAMPRCSGGRAYRCLVFDLVDPATAEALAYEAASFTADGAPQATSAPPHRVRLVGDGPGGAIVRGGEIDIRRRGVVADGVGGERIGPVAALDLAP